MKKQFLLSLFIVPVTVFGQFARQLDGRWIFAGSRVILFTAQENNLFVSIVNENERGGFSDFYRSGKLRNKLLLSPVSIDSSGSKCFLSAVVKPSKSVKLLFFVYDAAVDSVLNVAGDVYYDTAKVKRTNSNCDLAVPHCDNYFYKKGDIGKISGLKDMQNITRNELFEAFTRFDELSKTKCNRCYEGFPDGDFNRVLVSMGYNPIQAEVKNGGYTAFDISALSYIKEKFIIDGDQVVDQELYDHYKKILGRLWGRD